VTTPFAFGPLEIDPVALAIQGNAVLGIKESGKSYTSTGFAEHFFEAQIPFVAFDPIGIWRFLRVPGRGRGYPVVVAGGQDGDLALTPDSAPAIVEAALQGGISLVIDLFDASLSKAAWRRIVRECIALLLHRNKEFGLRHVFLEEAAEFVPQTIYDGQTYAEVEKLVRMGGNSGLGYTLISPRAEEINKAVLELCENLFLHRQRGKNAIVSLGKWLDVAGAENAGEIRASLSSLGTGECWAWLGDHGQPVRLQVPEKNSFHPNRRLMGAAAGKVGPQPPVDVAGFVAELRKALAAAAPAEAATPAPLAGKKGKAAAPSAATVAPAPDRPASTAELAAAEQRGMEAGTRAGFKQGVAYARRRMLEISEQPGLIEVELAAELDRLRLFRQALTSALGSLDHESRSDTSLADAPVVGIPQARAAKRPAAKPAPQHEPSVYGITGPQTKVLEALAWWRGAGQDAPTRTQIAVVAGWSPASSNIRDRLTELNKAGLIRYVGRGSVSLTDAGIAAAPKPDTSTSLRDYVRAILTNPQRTVLDVLLNLRGKPIARDDLARAVGWSPDSSNIRDRLTELSKLDLIERPSRGFVQAAPWLFQQRKGKR
jgi:hypothetical protein